MPIKNKMIKKSLSLRRNLSKKKSAKKCNLKRKKMRERSKKKKGGQPNSRRLDGGSDVTQEQIESLAELMLNPAHAPGPFYNEQSEKVVNENMNKTREEWKAFILPELTIEELLNQTFRLYNMRVREHLKKIIPLAFTGVSIPNEDFTNYFNCLLYTSPSPRD